MSRKAWIVAACLFLFPSLTQAIDHPTSKPYETRPSPDGFLPYQILPIPDGLKIEKDVMIPMPDGVKLACNVVRPDKTGKFAVVLAVTPYGKDHTPPIYNKDGSPLPGFSFPQTPVCRFLLSTTKTGRRFQGLTLPSS
ncbi:MAG: hypothetical protein CVU64_04585 [Deltaproteobacteria bacterium HGW-Deltaproteobacteria-21]|nr:MAG: hypothetical protein CVU64_04585 [Deltaproteobacteria bacterium HGW-Deltaproteobacteria-21]